MIPNSCRLFGQDHATKKYSEHDPEQLQSFRMRSGGEWAGDDRRTDRHGAGSRSPHDVWRFRMRSRAARPAANAASRVKKYSAVVSP
jgi:hypothetical protein